MRLRLLTFLILLYPFTTVAQTIYATEFEEFTTGNNNWIDGANGWIGNSDTTSSHGIDEDLIQGLGKTAFIGFNQPSSTLVNVVKQHDYDPVAAGQPIVNFESLIGIEDSTNNFRDTFSVVFLNSTGSLLAAIRFRNDDNVFGIWRSDGSTLTDTSLDFIHGELQLLTAQIDFSNNTWSAQIDGVDLFADATFHAGAETRNLGFTGVQWDLTSNSTANHGNNFMVVTDWIVQSVPIDDFQISSVTHSSDSSTINFFGSPGFEYKLETSTDLLDWSEEITNDTITDPAITGLLNFTHSSTAEKRFYRIIRDFAPPATE